MRIGRTLPPAAAPLAIGNIVSAMFASNRSSRHRDRFTRELTAAFKADHCFLLSSGKAALTIILESLQELYPDRHEVVIPAFTCYSVPSAIIRAGLTVRLCDVDPQTMDFDFAQLDRLLADKPADSPQPGAAASLPLCILPTHLFGLPADIKRLRTIIGERDIPLVEDAAQAMGSRRDGLPLGRLGDVGFFSLGRGKALSTIEGGIILTDNEQLARGISRRISDLPQYPRGALIHLLTMAVAICLFQHPLFFWFPKSLPFIKLGETIYNPRFPIYTMSEAQAALTQNWRKTLAASQEHRTTNNRLWMNDLAALTARFYLSESDSPLPLLRFPMKIDTQQKRDEILRHSEQRGYGIMPAYPSGIHAIPELAGMFSKGYPGADLLGKTLLTLPAHAYVTPKDRRGIIGLLKKLLT